MTTLTYAELGGTGCSVLKYQLRPDLTFAQARAHCAVDSSGNPSMNVTLLVGYGEGDRVRDANSTETIVRDVIPCYGTAVSNRGAEQSVDVWIASIKKMGSRRINPPQRRVKFSGLVFPYLSGVRSDLSVFDGDKILSKDTGSVKFGTFRQLSAISFSPSPLFSGMVQFLQRSAEEGRYDTKIPKLRGDEKSIMRMVRILFFLPLALLLVPMVFATAPQSGTGGFTITISNQQTRTAGGNTIITQDEVITITGVMSGTCTGSETEVGHADGNVNGHGSCDFTGMVQEKAVSGTFQFNAVNNGKSFIGHFGTTHNSGIHIQGTFQPTGPTSGTYTANFHFDS